MLGQRVEAASERLGGVAARLARGMEAEAEGVGKAFAGGWPVPAGHRGIGLWMRPPVEPTAVLRHLLFLRPAVMTQMHEL